MRSLILATASVIALGLGSAGAAPLSHGYSGNVADPNAAAPPTTAAPAEAAPPAAPAATSPPAPAAPSAAAPPPPTAHRHRAVASTIQHRRLAVKEAQRVLRRDGLYHGAIDGIIGPETRRAVAHYQRMHGLPVTANLNHRTLESLLAGHTTGHTPMRMHRSSMSGQRPPNATGGQGMETGGAIPNNVHSGAAAPGSESGGPGMGTAGAPPSNPPNNVNSGAAAPAPAPQH
jgi:peptidoglycan hydrolase-like protein with peptidoglycan-binding domain